MSGFPSFTYVPPACLELMQRVVTALPGASVPSLLQNTLALTDLSARGLGFEHDLIRRALSDPSTLDQALALYQRPGRLFYAVAPHAEELRSALGLSIEMPEAIIDRPEDKRAQFAWQRFAALEKGATEFVDQGVFYDPVSAMSHGVIHYLDREGQNDRRLQRRARGEDWTPPPSFGVLSRESPERLEQYNRCENDHLGDLAFDYPPELQMVVVPRVYAPLLRSRMEWQVVINASDQLKGAFTPEKARELPKSVRLLTGMKGLPGGRTPLELFDDVLKEAGLEVPVSDAMGYASASRIVREQRLNRAGRRGQGDLLEIVLSDPHTLNALEIAKRWTNAGDRGVRQETYRGVPLVVVENLNLRPPLKVTIVSDRDVIRANEKASIDKNLQAIKLGKDLFERMLSSVMDGQMGDPLLYREFAKFYEERMEQAEYDILAAMELEDIPENKRVILPGVRKDLYGSWTTTSFEPLYQLVQKIFNPETPEHEWQEAMVLLKLKIGEYYSVRNPQYGFCMAVDRAAVMAGRYLSREKLVQTVERLRAKGLLVDQDGKPLSHEKIDRKVGLRATPNGAHFFFSTIPQGLSPEGLQIAEQLPNRHGRKRIKRLPKSYEEAHLHVERLQNSVFFDPEIYSQIVDLSREFGGIFAGAPAAQRLKYLSLLEALNSHFEKALGALIASKHVYPRIHDTQELLKQLVVRMRILIGRVRENSDLGPEEIALLNQGMIETLTVANLFFMLPPEEMENEVRHLLRRLKAVLHYAKSGDIEDLFPLKSGDSASGEPGVNAMLAELKQSIFPAVSGGLIELTYRMNVRLHSGGEAVEKKHVMDALQQIAGSLKDAVKSLDGADFKPRSFLDGVANTLDGIAKDFQANKKISKLQRLFIYQALVECLIHTRRFLVLPPDRAGLEFQYTVKRFLKIHGFVQGTVESPLWFFGNGNSNPPPPAG
ncbi:MAG TPA: hypothetical protein VLJ37_08340 [bacterium]|nr:hypothetical protein [bacterium]